MPDPSTFLDVDGSASILDVPDTRAEVWTETHTNILDPDEA